MKAFLDDIVSSMLLIFCVMALISAIITNQEPLVIFILIGYILYIVGAVLRVYSLKQQNAILAKKLDRHYPFKK